MQLPDFQIIRIERTFSLSPKGEMRNFLSLATLKTTQNLTVQMQHNEQPRALARASMHRCIMCHVLCTMYHVSICAMYHVSVCTMQHVYICTMYHVSIYTIHHVSCMYHVSCRCAYLLYAICRAWLCSSCPIFYNLIRTILFISTHIHYTLYT
jgi:hypothetical protein